MGSESVLSGSLGFIALADVFQILGSNNSTGILRITSPYVSTPGLVYIVNGNPVNAAMGTTQGINALYRFFGWAEGSFDFREQDVHVKRSINQSPMQIVLDALRMLDDGLIQKVGPDETGDQEEPEEESGGRLRVIRGPLIDYTYVIGEEEFMDGQRIVREGGHGNWIWVVLEGVVEVSKQTSEQPVKIARLGDGCFIGGFAHFIHGGNKRSATVTAKGKVQLGVLDTERLSREFAPLSPDFKGILASLDKRLRQVTHTLANLTTGEARAAKPKNGKELNLDRIYEKRDIFVIQEGRAVIVARTRKGSLPVIVLEKNDFFGYTSFTSFGQDPDLTSIITSRDVQLGRPQTDRLLEEYNRLSGTFRSLIQNQETAVSITTRTLCER